MLKEWLSTGKQINQKGHIWIPKERLITPSFRSINSYFERANFYSLLSQLAKNISDNGGSKIDLKNLKNLMNQGIKEVPVFEQYWKEGLAMLNASPTERKLWIKSFQASLERPFLYLYLRDDFRYEFEAESQVHVGKILFFFGGFKRSSKVDFSFLSRGFDGQNYKGIFEGKHHTKQSHFWRADFYMDTLGELKRLKPVNSVITPTMINMAGFLARGTLKDLNNPTGKKTIFLGSHRGIKKNKLELKMIMELGEVFLKEGKPLLLVNYKLSEEGADRGDNFNLSGDGQVILSSDGLMQEMDSNVRFQLKLFKIGLINGFSKDHIHLKKASIYPKQLN